MNTETLLGALVESRKALVESQRAIDAILLQHTNAGNAELAGEQSAMGRISMSNADFGSANYQPVMFDMDRIGDKKVPCLKLQVLVLIGVRRLLQ